MKKFEDAARSLSEGKPILLYDFDDREAETDLIYLAENIDEKAVADLRLSAGAPLTVYISWGVGISRLRFRECCRRLNLWGAVQTHARF